MALTPGWRNEWCPVGTLEDFKPDRLEERALAGEGRLTAVAMLRREDELWAFRASCPSCGSRVKDSARVSAKRIACRCGEWEHALPLDPEATEARESGVVPVMLTDDEVFVWLGPLGAGEGGQGG